MSVYSVLYSLLSRHRMVLLKEMQGERFLPIWIGQYESEAIAMHLQGTVVPRPLTHDLLANTIAEFGGAIQYVIINDLLNSTFYARIAIDLGDHTYMIDSRPSDAIALAVRVSVPIYASVDVMREAGIVHSPDVRDTTPTAEELDVFSDFIDSLDLDDLDS